MLTITKSKEFNSSAIYTITNLNPKSLQNLDRNGDGSSGRSEYVSKLRAFRRGEAIVWCHKNKLSLFQTLTYKNQHQDYNMILNDLKNVFSRKKISYVGVVEKHKSGNYHCHFLTSDIGDDLISLKKGKFSNKAWTKGFSDVKFISDTDEKFRVEKYIFKYMLKSEKIGGRYLLKSRDLTVSKSSLERGAIPYHWIHNSELAFLEERGYTGDGYHLTVRKEFYD